MSNELALSVECLKATVGAQNTLAASNLLHEITAFFDKELTDAVEGM